MEVAGEMKHQNQRVIFLDVDGVLNSIMTEERADHQTMMPTDGPGFIGMGKEFVDRLNDVIRETGAVVCVSSTWRIGQTVESIQRVLHAFGVSCEVIGMTKDLRRRPSGWDPYGPWSAIPTRGDEIDEWLEDNGPVAGFAVIDDSTDAGMGKWSGKRYVQTYDGMTPEDAQELMRMLMLPLDFEIPQKKAA